MHKEHLFSTNPIEELLYLYRNIMDNPCFDQYEAYKDQIAVLFDRMTSAEISESDRLLLIEIRIIHEHIIRVISMEKEELNEEIDLFERKKRVSNHYGKISYNNGNAFFVDYKK